MPTPILSVAEIRRWEADSWKAGRVEADVIAAVGRRLAERLSKLIPRGESILILAGKGNNGADAQALHSELARPEATLLWIEQPERDLPALDAALTGRPCWIVDGLFGVGLNRPLDAAWVAAIERINTSGARVVSIDLPSGLDGDTGHPLGVAARAELTLAVGAPKPGLVQTHAVEFVGRLEVVHGIGLLPAPEPGNLAWFDGWGESAYPPRKLASHHKGTGGHLAILAGSAGCHGAAVLAARGAARARPGLITVYCDEPTRIPIASQLQAQMVHPGRPSHDQLARHSAILVGPGLVKPDDLRAWRGLARTLWKSSPLPVVVDASSLAWLQPGPVDSPAPRVVTPHPGEAARMLGCDTAAVQADRLEAARELSRQFGGCLVALKGRQTVVGSASGPLSVNGSGNPSLGQGGSGDILAGFLAGFLAQPDLAKDPLRAARHAVWRHGQAADELEAAGLNWTIDQLPLRL